MVLRGDRDFEPETELAVKRLAWHREAIAEKRGVDNAELASSELKILVESECAGLVQACDASLLEIARNAVIE
eukprot:5178546-Amphidinium_carterae.1